MTLLVIGLALFIGIHLLPSIFPLRSLLFNRLGEGRYKGIYTLVSLIGLGLIIYGKAYASFEPIWVPPFWTRYIAWAFMLPALFLVIAANMPGNIKRFTPHPMMWGVLIWASVHLLANGDLASIVLFGSFAVFSIIHMVTSNMRGAVTQSSVNPGITDIRIVGATLITYIAIGVAHPYLFRMPAFFY